MAEYTLRQLGYFVAVAECGSVTNAAANVHLSQSAMSTALADLERALDIQLLTRHRSRGVTLTAAGEHLLVACRRLLAEADDLMNEAHGLGQKLAGSFSLGCFGVLAPYVLPEVAATCADRYPELRLETHEVDLDALAEGVLGGRFELGLGYDLAADPRLTRSRVRRLSPYILLPAAHKLARRSRIRLDQLTNEPLALLDLPQSREYFQGLFSSVGIEPLVRYRSTNVETVRALVGRGLAYTLLNLRPSVSMSLDGREVVAVPLDPPGAPLDVVLIAAAGGRLTRRAEAVAEVCAEVLGQRG